jgi:hypothetical protein
VRVRITKALTGIIEGRPLSEFLPGFIYHVDDVVGAQLIELGAAIEVRSTDPAPATDSKDVDVDLSRLAGGIRVLPPDKADDRRTQRRRVPRPTADRRSATSTQL